MHHEAALSAAAAVAAHHNAMQHRGTAQLPPTSVGMGMGSILPGMTAAEGAAALAAAAAAAAGVAGAGISVTSPLESPSGGQYDAGNGGRERDESLESSIGAHVGSTAGGRRPAVRLTDVTDELLTSAAQAAMR